MVAISSVLRQPPGTTAVESAFAILGGIVVLWSLSWSELSREQTSTLFQRLSYVQRQGGHPSLPLPLIAKPTVRTAVRGVRYDGPLVRLTCGLEEYLCSLRSRHWLADGVCVAVLADW